MPIRGSPNGARHLRPQAGRNRPEWVVAINRNAWSQSIGIAGRDHPVRAPCAARRCPTPVALAVGQSVSAIDAASVLAAINTSSVRIMVNPKGWRRNEPNNGTRGCH
jgi:hypothetical protein